MVTARQVERWVRRSRRVRDDNSPGLFSRLAWRRFRTAALRGDDLALTAMCQVAQDPGHPRSPEAGTVVADRWVCCRDTALLPVLKATGALASPAVPRLVTAALHDVLEDCWAPADASAALHLLSDPDELVRSRAATACQRASDPLLAGLWDLVLAWAQPVSAAGPTPQDAAPPWWRQQLPTLLLNHRTPAPTPVLDWLWRTWLQYPDPSLWSALVGWQIPASSEPGQVDSVVALDPDLRRLAADPVLRTALVQAARRDSHPLGGIARDKILRARDQDLIDSVCEAALTDQALAAWCVEQRFAPREPIRRVVFFLLTGQPDQYRGMDPDGSLLSSAYAAADASVRTRMQATMRSTGGLDLVRVLVGEDRRARIQHMSDSELDYLSEQLAARGEWRDLWGIAQDLPLRRGVRLVRLFNGWAPSNDDDRSIFTRLRSTNPDLFEGALRTLQSSWPMALRQSRITFQGRVNDVSFAPDAPLLAVAGGSRVAGVIDLTRGKLIERYEGFGASVGRVQHIGAGTFVAAERTRGASNPCRLVRCADSRHRVLHQVPGSITSIALARPNGDIAAGTRSGVVLLGSPQDGRIREVPVSRLGLDPDQDWPRSIAAHPQSGRLAVLGRELVLTDDLASAVIATGYHRTVISRALFATPESLAVSDQGGTVRLLRRVGHQLVPVHSVEIAGLGGMASILNREQLVAADRAGGLSFFDARTLAMAGRVGGSEAANATSLHVSPAGEYLAVGYDAGFTDLYDLRVGEVPALANRALVAMVPAHLGVIASARAARDVQQPVREVLDLLQACLEHRFRFDIELGDAVALSAGEYDISL